MATKEIVGALVKTFCEIHQRKISDILLKEYYRAFKIYSDDQIRKAGFKTIDEYAYFPKPAHIIERINVDLSDQGSVKYSRTFCSDCGKLKGCIKENDDPWICPECYSGLSKEERRYRFQVLGEAMDKGFPEGMTTPEARFEYIKNRAKELMNQPEEKII